MSGVAETVAGGVGGLALALTGARSLPRRERAKTVAPLREDAFARPLAA
jgi:hypothetical protein